MKTEKEILKLGDDILTEEKKDINHITSQLNKDETISYNKGFHSGFLKGYMANEKNTKTILHITTEVPFIEFATYDFLYTTSKSSVIELNDKKYKLVDSCDVIDEKGNITRYLRFF